MNLIGLIITLVVVGVLLLAFGVLGSSRDVRIR